MKKLKKTRTSLRDMSPIAQKLKYYEANDVPLTKIAAACSINYWVIHNCIQRGRVSYMTLIKLKAGGIINEEDEANYERWLIEKAQKERGAEPKEPNTGVKITTEFTLPDTKREDK